MPYVHAAVYHAVLSFKRQASRATAATVPAIDLGQLDRFGMLADGAMAFADGLVNQQAAMIAYLDDFWLMSWMSFAVVPFVFLLRNPKGPVAVVHSE